MKYQHGTVTVGTTPAIANAHPRRPTNKENPPETTPKPFANLFESMVEGFGSNLECNESNKGSNDDFPSNADEGSDEQTHPNPQSQEERNGTEEWHDNIVNPSTVELPQVIQNEMFKAPPNFDDKYLYNQVLEDKNVMFRPNMANRMTAEEKSNL